MNEIIGIDIPIIQAPTGSVAGPELAAAVSGAGALGSLGLTWTDPEAIPALATETRALAPGRPFAANFALAFEPRGLDAALDAGVPIITLSWGDGSQCVKRIHAAGAIAGIQAGCPEGVRKAEEAGADFVICQGVEAGGHVQSTTSLADFLESLQRRPPSIPIVAAGGLANGADIARVLERGACAAMLGTRFVATRESRAHEDYRRAIAQSLEPDATALTVCFSGGWEHAPHRVLRNRTLIDWEAAGCPPPGRRPGDSDTVAFSVDGEPILRYEDTAPRDGMTGRIGEMALYAGTGAARITDIPPAAELVRRLWEEALAAIGNFRFSIFDFRLSGGGPPAP